LVIPVFIDYIICSKSTITRTELSAQMIASLNLFIIGEITGFVSHVAIIYIGILPLRIQKDVCGTFNKFYLCLKSKCNFKSSIALYIYVTKPIFKSPAFSEEMSCFYNNPSGNPSSCKQGNEPLDSIKDVECVYWLS
jgi:hypothetical protein